MMTKKDMEPCPHCRGTGKILHECQNHQLVTVKNHPLNQTDWEHSGSQQGYVVRQCEVCRRVWGIRYQWDDGTGSDSHEHCFGKGDPFKVAKRRHY